MRLISLFLRISTFEKAAIWTLSKRFYRYCNYLQIFTKLITVASTLCCWDQSVIMVTVTFLSLFYGSLPVWRTNKSCQFLICALVLRCIINNKILSINYVNNKESFPIKAFYKPCMSKRARPIYLVEHIHAQMVRYCGWQGEGNELMRRRRMVGTSHRH